MRFPWLTLTWVEKVPVEVAIWRSVDGWATVVASLRLPFTPRIAARRIQARQSRGDA
jgi:hypothetical protein